MCKLPMAFSKAQKECVVAGKDVAESASICPRTAAGGVALSEFESLKDFHNNNPLQWSLSLLLLKENCYFVDLFRDKTLRDTRMINLAESEPS